jgi:hypothetical protein
MLCKTPKALDNRDFLLQLFKGLLFSTGLASTTDVASAGFRNFERTAENALLASQEIGRATINVLLFRNHKDILDPLGYYCH